MDEVLDQVAIAFEEDGVNHSVLDELKKVRAGIYLLFIAIFDVGFICSSFSILTSYFAFGSCFGTAFLALVHC